MARDYDPVQGKWYEDLEENEVFKVLSVDPDQELVEVQYENGDIGGQRLEPVAFYRASGGVRQ